MIQFDSLQEFFAMGGYAANVWSVYAMFALFLAVNLLWPMRRKKQLMKEIKRRQVLNTETAQPDEPDALEMEPLEPLMDSAKSVGEST